MSAVVYAVFAPWVVRLLTRGAAGEVPVLEGTVAALTLLLPAPFVLGTAMAQLRRRGLSIRWLRWLTSLHPAPSAWDFAFEQTGGAFLRIRLRDGTVLGGAFGEGSFASSYPEPPSVFLKEAWRLDDEGRFIAPVDGSLGLYVGLDDVESVEWLEVREDGEQGD